MVKTIRTHGEQFMIDSTARTASVSSGHADGRQADSAGELVEMISRRRELERTGTAATADEAVHADASGASGAAADVPGAQQAGHDDGHWQEVAPVARHGTTATAADALLAVFAIDEDQWAKLLAELPFDTLTELLGHAFRLYQRIAIEETNRRFEQDVVGPPEPSPPRAVTEG